MKKLTKGIRSDKLKRLHESALAQGWESRIDGNGHLCITQPETGKRFWISTTNNGGAMGRHWENTKAKARRAGLDVSGL